MSIKIWGVIYVRHLKRICWLKGVLMNQFNRKFLSNIIGNFSNWNIKRTNINYRTSEITNDNFLNNFLLAYCDRTRMLPENPPRGGGAFLRKKMQKNTMKVWQQHPMSLIIFDKIWQEWTSALEYHCQISVHTFERDISQKMQSKIMMLFAIMISIVADN